VKNRIQLTPALTAALLFAVAWLALWLLAFRPTTPFAATAVSLRTEFTRLIADEKTLNKLKTPTLFALPSEEGFSGRFIEERIHQSLTLEKPASPARYLPMAPSAVPEISPALLTASTVLPQRALPAPGVAPQIAAPPVTGTRLFFSPELKPRTGDLPPLTLRDTELPETVRVTLSVRADGTVEHSFFETPVTNAALLSTVRQLLFKPALKKTEGWVDIRFAQEGGD